MATREAPSIAITTFPHTPFLPPDIRIEMEEGRRLKHPPVHLDEFRRYVVDATIREVSGHRRWTIHAFNVRTMHVHMVVTAPKHTPERVMNDFKSWDKADGRGRRVSSGCEAVEPTREHEVRQYTRVVRRGDPLRARGTGSAAPNEASTRLEAQDRASTLMTSRVRKGAFLTRKRQAWRVTT